MDDPQRALQIQEMLTAQDIPVNSLQTVSPSVEDLFIALLDQDIGKAPVP